jgi:hypothetical protein
MSSPTPISYWWSVDIFRLSLTVFELFAYFGSAAKDAPPSGENISINSPTPTSYWWSVDTFPLSPTISKLFANFHPLLHL